jgi:hypothetical protein
MAADEFDNIGPEESACWLCWPGKRVIKSCNSDQPLLVRYFLLHTKPISIFVHHLMQSDEERALHDHPWSFLTILLSGGYWEHTTTERIWRRRFSILWRPAEWQHRLELDRPVWTLVVKFRSRREWGFILPGVGWQRWSHYLTEWCND